MKRKNNPQRDLNNQSLFALAILAQTLIAVVAMTLISVLPANAQNFPPIRPSDTFGTTVTVSSPFFATSDTVAVEHAPALLTARARRSATFLPDGRVVFENKKFVTESSINLNQDVRNLVYAAAAAVVVSNMNNNGADEKYIVGFNIIAVVAVVDNVISLGRRNNRL